MNTIEPTTSRFKTLQIVHGALCTGVILFLIITTFLRQGKGHIAVEASDSPLLFVAVVLAVVAPFLSKYLYQKQLNAIDLTSPLDKRFPQYISACIIRYAVMDAAALFNVVIWYLTGSLIAAIVAGALILLLIALRPRKALVTHILQINYPETLD